MSPDIPRMKTSTLINCLRHDGQDLILPHEIELFGDPIKAETWGENALKEAKTALGKFMRGLRSGWVRWDFPMPQTRRILTLLIRPMSCHWLLDGGKSGAGHLYRYRMYDEGWMEHSAYITPPNRRQGLYGKVLQTLQRELGRVWSDKKLSPAALRVWKRIGAYEPIAIKGKKTARFSNPHTPSSRVLYAHDVRNLIEALNYFAAKV